MHLDNSELGKKSAYQTQYNPGLLFPIPRAAKRSEIGIDDSNPGFSGEDVWTHYEVSWLNAKGKPCVAIGEISYSALSPNIIESKSMKLYFNSFNGTRFASESEVVATVVKDLSAAVGAAVKFMLIAADKHLAELDCSNKLCLDDLDIECDVYQPKPEYLTLDSTALMVKESVYTHLLKSNCLVTNQPDWGSVFIEYMGQKIDHAGLLKYIISLRDHNEFHEQCVERIFNDIMCRCKPQELTVYARYTRRGGLDINPFRTTRTSYTFVNHRVARQ